MESYSEPELQLPLNESQALVTTIYWPNGDRPTRNVYFLGDTVPSIIEVGSGNGSTEKPFMTVKRLEPGERLDYRDTAANGKEAASGNYLNLGDRRVEQIIHQPPGWRRFVLRHTVEVHKKPEEHSLF